MTRAAPLARLSVGRSWGECGDTICDLLWLREITRSPDEIAAPHWKIVLCWMSLAWATINISDIIAVSHVETSGKYTSLRRQVRWWPMRGLDTKVSVYRGSVWGPVIGWDESAVHQSRTRHRCLECEGAQRTQSTLRGGVRDIERLQWDTHRLQCDTQRLQWEINVCSTETVTDIRETDTSD